MHRFALFALLGTSLLHSGWAQAHRKGMYDSQAEAMSRAVEILSLIHISEPTRR